MTKSIRARATALALATTAAGLALPAGAAHAATTCSTGVWVASYYANTTFKGTPKKTACDTSINENYGTGDPAGVTLPKDNFGVRWNLSRDFGSGGPFTFTAAARDGIRVYLDGTRKIDLWKDVSTTRTKTLNLTIPKGKHTLRVDFAAFKGSANVKFTYAPRTTASVDKTKPLAPTGLKAPPSGHAFTLAWTRGAEMDLAGYRVHRRTGTGAWTRISGSALVTTTGYRDLPAATGAKYSYAVSAVDKAGNDSGMSTAVTVTSIDGQAPAAPTGLKAAVTADGRGYALTWSPNADTSAYQVYRATSATGPWTLLDTVAAPSYTDTKVATRTQYFYTVIAMDAATNFSGRSAAASAAPLAIRPDAPRNVAAVSSGSVISIKVTWNLPSEQAVGSYTVYRSTTSPVDPSTATALNCAIRGEGELGGDTARFSCTDGESLRRGVTYHYAVTQTADGLESPLSGEAAVALPGDEEPPAKVAGLTVVPAEYGVRLHWDPNTEPDLARYTVYRGEVYEDEEERVCLASAVDWLSPGTTEYVAERLPDGEEGCYFVDATDIWGNSLFLSERDTTVVEFTELDLTPSVGTPEGSPVDLTAHDVSDGVRLGWNDVADAVGYRVYRWDRDTGRYESLTSEPVTATAWTDTTAARGTTHFYWVRAVYADGTESLPGGGYAIRTP
ncbi:PA14 domain-containing protein [Actinacidiphila glaucinigra]|uniref:PA14 domain-containing protein n=1 Tax=Actinacidiphila glaucinigra TaxID=235986 RepID=UPI002DDBD94C|nr:PA14 domain-containing protein [Actinacidiphila glaucinigra]WSD61323.1 PA14 domain-containing protein [Actinacidiphila glaucinigra]